MNVLVCIAKTPDTTAKINFKDKNTQFDTTNVQYIMNPTDEWYALVRAIEVKEQTKGKVTVIHVGPKANDQIIRKALAIGADQAARVDLNPTDAYEVAAQIAAYAKDRNFDLIFTGKETIDYNGFTVGGMLAELLDLPYISLAKKMTLAENTATIVREIDGGAETIKVDTPFVISAQKGLAEQRIPNMRGIMQARRKKLVVIKPIAVDPLTSIANYELPPARQDVHLIDPEHPEQLVKLLHEEAKVI